MSEHDNGQASWVPGRCRAHSQLLFLNFIILILFILRGFKPGRAPPHRTFDLLRELLAQRIILVEIRSTPYQGIFEASGYPLWIAQLLLYPRMTS